MSHGRRIRKKLFVDDYEIEEMDGLERKLHQPTKYTGNPVLKGEYRWENVSIQSRSLPQWVTEEKVWKIWYIASETRWEGKPGSSHMCYAFSLDGIHWKKPMLGVFNYHASTQNNIILDSYIENIIYDDSGLDRSCRYKGLAGASGRVAVVSEDGIHWKKTGADEIQSSDESFMTFDETSGQYLATVKVRGPYGGSVALATSKDFYNWTVPRLIFHADERDQQLGRQRIYEALADPNRLVPPPEYVVPESFRTDIYNMPIFPYEGLYMGLPCIFNQTGPTPDGNQDGFLYVELASSRDMKKWHRVANRAVFIDSGPKRSYDSGMILSAGRPILRDNELWFYYNGFSKTHGPYLPEERDVGAICLAKLRIDGFVSLDAGESEGILLTKSLVVEEPHLFVNVEAPHGVIRAEILQPNGETIAGFSLEECTPVQGDHIRTELNWKCQKALSELVSKTVQIRFLLRKTNFYAFWFEE